ncbi:Cyclin-dependent kinase inhibitor 1B [Liparis tanakae]|uniref:Cyclin-dependent kinase inhibitor 1B n=1 Tax=Liparis tanakae TaxID=230148 RepID=A0A4Z2GCP5_9TELE|nr:Cyclin-dependent kinase inhibitor 1B [Liparis tanakae]
MDAAGRREPVCRSLFGPVDHEQLRRDLALKLRELEEQDSRRWNFNFHTETPLSGRFQWDEVPAAGRFQWDEVPAAAAAAVYRECARPTDGACCSAVAASAARGGVSDREDGAGKDQENRSSVSNTRRACPAEATTAARRKRTLSRPAAKPGRNARITDFFAKRRRTAESRSILTPFLTSSSEAAACKTLR